MSTQLKQLPSNHYSFPDYILNKEGSRVPFNERKLEIFFALCAQDTAEGEIDFGLLKEEVAKNLYEGASLRELLMATVVSARAFIELEPAYSKFAAGVLLDLLYSESDPQASLKDAPLRYSNHFKTNVINLVENGRLVGDMKKSFDLDYLARFLKPERDRLFEYIGLQTIYDRYLIRDGKTVVEWPQTFWMRVAMGLALNEKKSERMTYAKKFYELLSQFFFVSSTPTLFNAGTVDGQLSSCFLSTIPDSLEGVFSAIKENAIISKHSGGIGNDWSSIRGEGAQVGAVNDASQGVVPFLKVANDTSVAVNQGGRRKGATCAYLETWHIDVEEFLELRKNTGDERRRFHDMNTANWIPDLFMERVKEGSKWTLFSPEEVPGLHESFGEEFRKLYLKYESKAREGEIQRFKEVDAKTLWRKMLGMLYETGHPWLTFKDNSNLRSTQSHVGVVRHSNLCTEILLNTSKNEIAVCNLGSINLPRHLDPQGELDSKKLKKSVQTAMRMLDNVIDLSFYPLKKAQKTNLKHRPVGLGVMGFQDLLHEKKLAYDSQEAVDLAGELQEVISFHAIEASSLLAKEKGKYSSYRGSFWDRGVLPHDSYISLMETRGETVSQKKLCRLNWESLRKRIKKYGMRNSHCTAIAPTATISNITGVTQSIEPNYNNLFVKSNLSGEFTVINRHLVNELKALKLWSHELLNEIKSSDGSIQNIPDIPPLLKARFKTAFEWDQRYLIDAAAKRQVWIDMGQSLNLYYRGESGSELSDLYFRAWEKGLKTTYYLRALGASSIEASSHYTKENRNVEASPNLTLCRIEDDDCESCQ